MRTLRPGTSLLHGLRSLMQPHRIRWRCYCPPWLLSLSIPSSRTGSQRGVGNDIRRIAMQLPTCQDPHRSLCPEPQRRYKRFPAFNYGWPYLGEHP